MKKKAFKQKKIINVKNQNDKNLFSYSMPSNLTIHQRPLLSFTSFQQYLQECNQNQFYEKQHQKLFRSHKKAQTQAYFLYQREKSLTSESKKKRNLKINTAQNAPIEAFNSLNLEQENKNLNLDRNTFIKSEVSHYKKQNLTVAQSILCEKFGTIEGWSSQEWNGQKFPCSKNILNQKQTNFIKSKIQTNDQELCKKQNKIKTCKDSCQNFVKQPNKKKVKQHKNKNKFINKENCSSVSLLSSKLNNNQTENKDLQSKQTQKKNQNPLTSIKQLEQEILLQKRTVNIMKVCPSQSNSKSSQNNKVSIQNPRLQNKENSNIKMLKKQFEYLCKNQGYDDFIDLKSSSFPEISVQNSNQTKENIFKPFRKLHSEQNKQNAAFKEAFNLAPKFCLNTNCLEASDQASQIPLNMLKLMRSLKQSTRESRITYQQKTPCKSVQQNEANEFYLSCKSDITSVSRHKQKFQSSIQDKKNQSGFGHNSFCSKQFENQISKFSPYSFINEKKNPLMITTVFNSYVSGSKNRDKNKWTTKNCSIIKNIKNKLTVEQNLQQTALLKQNQNGDEQSFALQRDCFVNRQSSRSQGFYYRPKTQQLPSQNPHDQAKKNEQDESINALNTLSQQLKKCAKIVPSSYTSKYGNTIANKKILYFNKKAKTSKQKLSSNSKKSESQQNLSHNFSITQLQGRHIEQMRKKVDKI